MGPSIVDGVPITVTSKANHRALARWSMKVALLLSLWFHDEAVVDPRLRKTTAPSPWGSLRPLPYIPSVDFTDLHRRGRPSDQAMVWFGVAEVPTPFFMVTNPLFAKTESGLMRAGYSVVFAMRRLAVCVVVPFEEYRNDILYWLGISRPHDFDRERLVPVWPLPETTAWPPQRTLTTEDMERLIGAPVGWSSDQAVQTGSWRPGIEPA